MPYRQWCTDKILRVGIVYVVRPLSEGRGKLLDIGSLEPVFVGGMCPTVDVC